MERGICPIALLALRLTSIVRVPGGHTLH